METCGNANLGDPVDGPYNHQIEEKGDKVEGKGEEDKEMREAFEKWKSKSFSLTVPLRVIALRGSVPPSWVKVSSLSLSLFSSFLQLFSADTLIGSKIS